MKAGLPMILSVVGALSFGQPAMAQETFVVSGRVTNDQGGAIVDAVVEAHQDGMPWYMVTKAVTAGDGSFQIELSAGDYAFTATPPRSSDYVMKVYPDGPSCIDDNWPVTTVNNDIMNVDFELSRGGKISFSLLDEHGLGVDFEVVVLLFPLGGGWCYTWDEVSLDQGEYISPAINPGDYQIRIDSPNHEEYPSQYFCGDVWGAAAETATVAVNSTTDLGECQLVRTGSGFEVSGRITETGDGQLPGVIVRAYSDVTREVVASTETAEDGSYVLSIPEGHVGVQVEADPGPESWMVSEFWDDCSCQFEFTGFQNPDPTQVQQWCSDSLAAGTDHSAVDFDLEIGGRLRFQLLDDDGDPIDFPCPVRLERVESHPFPRGGTLDVGIICHDLETDSDGSFLSPLLVPGTYRIEIFPPEDSGYIDQAFCRLEWQMGLGENVESNEINDLGGCRLLTDEFEIRSASGYLFSFDDDWLLGNPQIVANSATAADINGDQLLDIVIGGTGLEMECQSAHGSPAMSVYSFINQGGNIFSNETATWVPFDYCGGPLVWLADFDCDGGNDLAIADWGVEWSDGTPWGAQDTIWKNVEGRLFEDTTGSWIPLDNPQPEIDEPSYSTAGFVLKDLEGDGDIDILRSTIKEQILINDGSGHFSVDLVQQESRDPAVLDALQWYAVTFGDLDADGLDDLIVADFFSLPQPLRLFRGLPDGTFESFTLQSVDDPLHLDALIFRVAAWDFDGDGAVEIYVGYMPYPPNVNESNYGIDPIDQLYQVEHLGDGVLVVTDQTYRLQQSENFNGTRHIFLADFDNDSDMDVIIANNSEVFWNWNSHPDIRILVNDGGGRFSLLALDNFPAFSAAPIGMTVFDSDNDGDVDIFIGANPVRSLLFVNRLLEKHDLNGDSYVTPSDAQLVVGHFGSFGPDIREDLNEDGVVDARDISLILRYQTTALADNSDFVPACVQEVAD